MGLFGRGRILNRAEALALVFGRKKIEPEENSDFESFSDVRSENWYAKYVGDAVARGWIGGFSDGTFTGGEKIIGRSGRR